MSGTPSSPLVIDTSAESSSEEEVAEGTSPLKVIKSQHYREFIEVFDSPEAKLNECDDSQLPSKICKKLKYDERYDEEPIYEIPPPKYQVERILKILLDPTIPPSKICSVRPTRISKSATYVVDVSKLKHPDDIKNDMFGSWKHSGSHPLTYKAQIEDDGYIRIEKCAEGARGGTVVHLRRLHSVHPANNSFKRLIAFLSDGEHNPHHLCLVTYHFPVDGFVPEIKPHGNSTVKKEPFHPTWSSTKQQIRQKCVDTGPKQVVASISAIAGGILGASAPGQLPRDEKQVTNFKAREGIASRLCASNVGKDAAADDLFLVMQKAYSEDPSNRFVRSVNAAPEPAIVVSTDRQLQDLSKFCCNSFEFCPLTVDPTFCLGSFDVTLITYRHLLLQSKRYRNPPVFIGPCCIHYKKSFATYMFFASTIIGQCSQLEFVRAIGTDGEKALIDAFKHEFGFAQHLTCFIHVRRNIKNKLHECDIPSQLSIEILDDVFGKTVGTTRVEGLVDACSETDFQERLDELAKKWQDATLPSSANIDSFLSWFQTKSVIIKDTMLSTVREECGLGCPPVPFTTNACETANFMLKNHTNYKKSEIFEFLQKLKELIIEQEREIERAIVGRGKYELRPQYRSFSVLESKWFVMSTSQRELHLQKVLNASVCETSSLSNDTIDQSSTCLGRDLTLSSSLSVSVDAVAGSVRVPLNCLEGIWNKAAELLRTDGAIVSAPGVGKDAKYVLSYTGQKPHLVVPKKGGSFACDQDCPNWKGLKICSHSVAVADLCGKLPEFITWYKKLKHIPNMSKFAKATMPKGRGQKGTRSPCTRKPPVAVEQVVRNPSLPSNKSVCNPHVSMVLSNHSTSQPNSPVVSQVNNMHLPVIEQTIFPSPGIYHQPPPPPHTWMYGYNQRFDNWTCRPHTTDHTSVMSPYCEGNYLIPGPFTSTHVMAPCEGNYSSLPSTPTPNLDTHPFILCKISGNIKVCAGCRNKYPKSPPPPDDLCIKHQEWREYIPEGTQVSKYRFGNAYYHFNPSCVKLRFPDFVPNHLQVPEDLDLSEAHKESCDY